MRHFVVFALAFAFAALAFCQPPPQPTPGPTPGQNQIVAIEGTVSPGPFVIQTVGETRTYQFTLMRLEPGPPRLFRSGFNQIGAPIEMFVYKDGQKVVPAPCSLEAGSCKISSDKPAVYNIFVGLAGGFGIFGTNATISIVPPQQNSLGSLVTVTANTAQARDFETVSVFADIPNDIPGAQSVAVFHGSRQNVDNMFFPNGLPKGQMLVFSQQVFPETAFNVSYVAVEVRDAQSGVITAWGGTDVRAKYGFQNFTAKWDSDGGTLTLDFDQNAGGMPPGIVEAGIVLSRNGQTLLLPATQYSTGAGQQLVYYPYSLGYNVQLPMGHYDVGYYARFNTGGQTIRTVPNGIWFGKQTMLQ